MKKRDKSFLTLLFFKSVLMGTVNKLPGISGGLVALITGFYIEMINSLKKLDFNVWYEPDTAQIIRVSYSRMGNWEYRLIHLE